MCEGALLTTESICLFSNPLLLITSERSEPPICGINFFLDYFWKDK